MAEHTIMDQMQKYIELVRHYNEEKEKETDTKPMVYLKTFGCQQNVSDSEKISGILAQMGYDFTQEPENASLILYNTCAVRENAEDRLFGNVGALKKAKKDNPNLTIGVCGCMMQQPHIADKIKKSYPHVDLCFGTHMLPQLPRLLWDCLNSNGRIFAVEDSEGQVVEGFPVRRDGAVKAWVPIMYGCNNFCTYCVVPLVRGRERSRESDLVVEEVRSLIQEGYKEITLLGQNVNSYGKTLQTPMTFAKLLRKLGEIPGKYRIRFMTSHPKDCTKELIDTIAEIPQICNHIHLPVQSGSNRVLKAMNRGYTVEQYLELVNYAKKTIPGVTFTSDIIVGFPGEQEEDFQKTLELVRRVEYQSLFTFLYSKRVGTKAAEFPDLVPAEEKKRWFQSLLDLQSGIGFRQYDGLAGSVLEVLAEGPGKIPGTITGRTQGGAIVEFIGSENQIGQFCNVRVEKSIGWALSGHATE